MAKADRILKLFPAFYRATERTKLLADVAGVLATPLEEIESNLFRIQRAHRLRVAEDVQDIVKLAGVLNLNEIHFEDIISDDALDYDNKLSLMRDRVQRVARVHLRGLGSPWAILESAAIFLRSAIVAEEKGDPLIKHVDIEGYSHKATVEFTHHSKKPRSYVYLHENPVRRTKIEPTQRWQLNQWTAENRSVVDAPIRLMIQGVSDHTVMPCIFCPTTGEGIIFNGQVAAGEVLIIDSDNGATLDGMPVNQWLAYFKGGIYDFGQWDKSPSVREDGQTDSLYQGLAEQKTISFVTTKIPLPAVPIGGSEWRFKVAEGDYNGDFYDFSVYSTESAKVGIFDGDYVYDNCSYDYLGGAVVGMAWDERIPCSFKLVLPARLPVAKQKSQKSGTTNNKNGEVETAEWVETGNVLSRVSNIMPRFKGASIRGFVDISKDSWILGESVVRDANAEKGEGIEFHATRLLNDNADTFVPLDT